MVESILSPLSGKSDFSKVKPKFPNGISGWKIAFHLLVFYKLQAFRLGSPLIASSEKMSWKWDLTPPVYHICRPAGSFE